MTHFCGKPFPIKPRLVCKSNPWRPRKLWIKTFNLAKLMGGFHRMDGWVGRKSALKKNNPELTPDIFSGHTKDQPKHLHDKWNNLHQWCKFQKKKRFTGPELGHNQIQQESQPWKFTWVQGPQGGFKVRKGNQKRTHELYHYLNLNISMLQLLVVLSSLMTFSVYRYDMLMYFSRSTNHICFHEDLFKCKWVEREEMDWAEKPKYRRIPMMSGKDWRSLFGKNNCMSDMSKWTYQCANHLITSILKARIQYKIKPSKWNRTV